MLYNAATSTCIQTHNVTYIIDEYTITLRFNLKVVAVYIKTLNGDNIYPASYVTIGHLNTQRQFLWQTKYSRVCLFYENLEI